MYGSTYWLAAASGPIVCLAELVSMNWTTWSMYESGSSLRWRKSCAAVKGLSGVERGKGGLQSQSSRLDGE